MDRGITIGSSTFISQTAIRNSVLYHINSHVAHILGGGYVLFLVFLLESM